MRKITRQACHAFENGYTFKLSNTQVKRDGQDMYMYLFNNLIAYTSNNKTYITLAGYNTSTTRERLNGLNGVRLSSKNFTPYLNGVEISSYRSYQV